MSAITRINWGPVVLFGTLIVSMVGLFATAPGHSSADKSHPRYVGAPIAMHRGSEGQLGAIESQVCRPRCTRV